MSPRPSHVAMRVLVCLVACLPLGAAATVSLVDSASARTQARVLERRFFSSAVRRTLRYRVYLPSGYSGGTQRYPVVYLLGGLPDAGTNFRDGRLQAVGGAAELMRRPVIVVAPQASGPDDTDPEFHDWGGGRNWETAIARQLVPTIDRRFRTIRSRGARALIGVSAGGYGAAIIAVHHPGSFSVAQSWSGYFYPTNPSGTARLSVGDAAANRRASVHSYVGWLARSRTIRLGFYVGADDEDFLADNRQLHRELVRARFPHRFAVYRGGHSGALWTGHLRDWVSHAVRQLTPAH